MNPSPNSPDVQALAKAFFLRGILGHLLTTLDLHSIDALDGTGRQITIRRAGLEEPVARVIPFSDPSDGRTRVVLEDDGRDPTYFETEDPRAEFVHAEILALETLAKRNLAPAVVDLVLELAKGAWEVRADVLVEDLPVEGKGA